MGVFDNVRPIILILITALRYSWEVISWSPHDCSCFKAKTVTHRK